ncbi:MAG: chemotaxis protein CheX [Bdellovibrionales bacterium]|nr:chemotaxis protein CheX [Bdellovibrionales bacterium]
MSAADELRGVFHDIWSVAVKKPLEELDKMPELSGAKIYETEIAIEGAWRGRIVFFTVEDVANFIARHMFLIDAPQMPSQEQIEDSLKEFTNVIGGNLKSALPEPCYLSLPIFSGIVPQLTIKPQDNEKLLADLYFQSSDGPVSAKLYQALD